MMAVLDGLTILMLMVVLQLRNIIHFHLKNIKAAKYLTLGAHAYESYCSHSVCVSVCYHSSASVQRSCDK